MSESGPADFSRRNLLLWTLVYVGLGGGVGSGILTAQGQRATEADLALRDERIQSLQRDINRLSSELRRVDEAHPPIELIEDVDDHEQRLRALESE